MNRFGKYCRTFLAGSLVFAGFFAISVVGASLSASPAAAATADSHPVASSLLTTLGASAGAGLNGSLALPLSGGDETSGWTAEKSANVLAKQGLSLADSCGSTSSCMSVGYYIDKSGIQVPQAEARIGSTWSVQGLPKIPDDQSGAFYDVSCASATACTAVGAYLDSSGMQVGLAEVFNGTSCSIETPPNASGAQVVSLSGVSCTSSTKCIAVGGSEDSSGNITTLVEQRNGSSWSIAASPKPFRG